ncbi:Herc2 [Symbiodinium sp. KB8]|nr:Herc2 [Symbiodinium sp. KB8]
MSAHGEIWVWGRNDYGQLGMGVEVMHKPDFCMHYPFLLRNMPMEGHALRDFACGDHHIVALTSAGAIYEWGDRHHFEPTAITLPSRYQEGLKGIWKVAAGESCSFALSMDGALYSWGRKSSGCLALGDSCEEWVKRPVQIPPEKFGNQRVVDIIAQSSADYKIENEKPVSGPQDVVGPIVASTVAREQRHAGWCLFLNISFVFRSRSAPNTATATDSLALQGAFANVTWQLEMQLAALQAERQDVDKRDKAKKAHESKACTLRNPAVVVGDATQGAEAAIRHLSESRNAAQSPMVEAKLREVFSEAMSGLDEAKLELAWNLDVSSVDLRNFLLIYGMRRSTGSRTTGLYRKQVSGHYVVSKEPTPAGPWEVAQAALEGGIVCADFVLTCEQVLELRCVETQEIKLHEESTVDHRLRLEAEWTAAQGDDREIPPIFDEERGWLITDLNGAADLNSPVAHLEEVE